MRLVHPSRWPRALLIAALGSTLAGLIPEALNPLTSALGLRSTWGIVIAVNLLLPLYILVPCILYPRYRWVPLLVVTTLVCFTTARALAMNPRVWQWTPSLWMGCVHPISVGVCIASGALACVAGIPLARLVRRVGLTDETRRCPACGYLFREQAPGPCPECGRIDPANTA